MNKPHKHAEVIKAWVDGKVIQRLTKQGWRDILHHPYAPPCNPTVDYRIKPEPKKTEEYRRCVLCYDGITYITSLFRRCSKQSITSLEESSYFVRWIDTEWQYHFVEGEDV
jgi:hypothetical protein